MSEYTETKIDLVLNHLSKQIYDELEAQGALSSNELYLVDEEYLDGLGVPIVNVGDPISSSDAATKNYVDGIASGFVPLTRTINGKPLSSNIILNASDVSALQSYNEFLSVILVDDGLKISDTAGVYHLILTPNGIEHNFPDSETHFLQFPPLSGTLAIAASPSTSGHVAILDSNGNAKDGGVFLSNLNMVETTYSDLLQKRTDSELIPGMQYRITDFITTINLEGTGFEGTANSAGHAFDIIVVADSVDKLNESARAIRHSGDSYFPISTKFEAWKIWYCLDNDKSRFLWADETNGKGVIYRMIDEFNNDVPYDFKNVRFIPWTPDDSWEDGWRYTFDDGEGNDSSLVADNYIFSNKICSWINTWTDEVKELEFKSLCLNRIVFLGGGCHSNTFGNDCNYNIFGSECHSNIFGNDCYSNITEDGFYFNIFGNGCQANTFGVGCNYNYFGNGCQANTFGNVCTYNSFGKDFSSNSFGNYCYSNHFGNSCNSNSFGNDCNSNSFGNECYYIVFGDSSNIKNNYKYITVESGNRYIYLNSTGTIDSSSGDYYGNVTISKGVNNKEDTGEGDPFITINDPKVQNSSRPSFHTTYQPANSQVVSV